MNLITRIILDLEHAGYQFRQKLRDIGISESNNADYMTGAKNDLEFLYHESAVHILLIHDPAINSFLQKLRHGPDMRFFAHISSLADLEVRTRFIEAYIEFGLAIAFQINRHLGASQEVEYLLDASAPGYLVISQVKREINFQPMMEQMMQHNHL